MQSSNAVSCTFVLLGVNAHADTQPSPNEFHNEVKPSGRKTEQTHPHPFSATPELMQRFRNNDSIRGPWLQLRSDPWPQNLKSTWYVGRLRSMIPYRAGPSQSQRGSTQTSCRSLTALHHQAAPHGASRKQSGTNEPLTELHETHSRAPATRCRGRSTTSTDARRVHSSSTRL